MLADNKSHITPRARDQARTRTRAKVTYIRTPYIGNEASWVLVAKRFWLRATSIQTANVKYSDRKAQHKLRRFYALEGRTGYQCARRRAR